MSLLPHKKIVNVILIDLVFDYVLKKSPNGRDDYKNIYETTVIKEVNISKNKCILCINILISTNSRNYLHIYSYTLI